MAGLSPSFLTRTGDVLELQEARQRLIASNIANADTPGYKARDINFSASLSKALETGQVDPQPLYVQNAPVGLDGNNVDLTTEKIKAVTSADQTSAAVTFLHQATTDLITALRPNPNGI